jgi:hypothetical protein
MEQLAIFRVVAGSVTTSKFRFFLARRQKNKGPEFRSRHSTAWSSVPWVCIRPARVIETVAAVNAGLPGSRPVRSRSSFRNGLDRHQRHFRGVAGQNLAASRPQASVGNFAR